MNEEVDAAVLEPNTLYSVKNGPSGREQLIYPADTVEFAAPGLDRVPRIRHSGEEDVENPPKVRTSKH